MRSPYPLFLKRWATPLIEDFQPGLDQIDLSVLGMAGMDALSVTQSGTQTVITLDGLAATITLDELFDFTADDFIFDIPVVTGTDEKDRLKGGDGGDVIDVGAGNDKLLGFGGADHLIGGSGKDKLLGGTGDDRLDGGAGNDKLVGEIGADSLNGGAANDRLHGGADADVLLGDSGNDKLHGDAGADRLTGGTGNDQLWGGSGTDVFIFAAGDGRDRIRDFEDGIDMIDLSGTTATGFADLSLTQSSNGAVIDLGNGARLSLDDIDTADLSASDFIF